MADTLTTSNGAAPSPVAYVVREPLTYHQHARHSYFVDLARAQVGNVESAGRLAAHRREMDVEMRAPNTTTGTGGEFAPPLWVIGQAGVAVNSGRVVADLIDRVGNLFPLPPGVSSVHVPKETTGATTTVQTVQGAAETDVDIVTGDANNTVTTIAGEQVVSQQLLDLTPTPGVDRIILNDLSANFNGQLDAQLLTGTGTGGQITGLANVTSINTIAAGAAVVPANLAGPSNMIAALWQVMGSALAKVGNTRLQPARHWLMAPRRWAAVSGSLDQQGRPVSTIGNDSPHQSSWPEVGGEFAPTAPVGPCHGLPVWQVGALSPSPASATDTIFAIRPRDLLLWESAPRFAATVEATAGALQVRLQLRKYVAFIGNRYPSGVCTITGLIQPTTSLTGATY